MNRRTAMDGDGQHPHKRLGAAIKRHREAINLTQALLAERAELLQGQVSNWERAERSIPSIDDIAALEEALDLIPGTLLVEAGYVQLPTSTTDMVLLDPALDPARREIVLDLYDAQVARSRDRSGSMAARTSPAAATRRRKS